jgi:hypothetical protein
MPYIIPAIAIGAGCTLGLVKYSKMAAGIFALYAAVITGYLALALYSIKLL